MDKFYQKIMKKCLNLAKKAYGKTFPNPMVGAILTDIEGNIISSGYHKMAGAPHAEVNCINNAPSNTDFSKTTLFVNLEPCSHFGKTPPCADLIIKKGIKKVVVGLIDPNEKVKGQGIKKLKENGIEVICPFMEEECKNFNKIFIKNITQKKPYIAIKIATTIDGKIATNTNSSKWITSDKSRYEVQKLRKSYQAIMTGSGTILSDNPNLTIKNPKEKNPIRIIFDRNFKTNFTHNVYKNDGTRIILITNKNIETPKHIETIKFENFDKLFKTLYEKGIYSIMIEAGQGLCHQIIKNKEADFLHHFIAPKIMGDGLGFVGNLKILDINKTIKLKTNNIKRFGDDILINYEFLK